MSFSLGGKRDEIAVQLLCSLGTNRRPDRIRKIDQLDKRLASVVKGILPNFHSRHAESQLAELISPLIKTSGRASPQPMRSTALSPHIAASLKTISASRRCADLQVIVRAVVA